MAASPPDSGFLLGVTMVLGIAVYEGLVALVNKLLSLLPKP
jgi:hypothetical protein